MSTLVALKYARHMDSDEVAFRSNRVEAGTGPEKPPSRISVRSTSSENGTASIHPYCQYHGPPYRAAVFQRGQHTLSAGYNTRDTDIQSSRVLSVVRIYFTLRLTELLLYQWPK